MQLQKPPPYDFAGEIERKAAHDARFADARDNNGNQPTCPYCYSTAMFTGVHNGKRVLACRCKS